MQWQMLSWPWSQLITLSALHTRGYPSQRKVVFFFNSSKMTRRNKDQLHELPELVLTQNIIFLLHTIQLFGPVSIALWGLLKDFKTM